MKPIFYSFSKDATNSQKANLGKLLKAREKKGKIKRIRRGMITVQDDHYDKVVEVIKRYKGIIDNPSELSDLSDDSLVNKLLNEIEQVTRKFSKLESTIFKLNDAKETQKKEIDQTNERLETFENQLSTVSKALTELKTAVEKKAAPINDTDLETIVQEMKKKIKREMKGRLDDLEAHLNAIDEQMSGGNHYF